MESRVINEIFSFHRNRDLIYTGRAVSFPPLHSLLHYSGHESTAPSSHIPSQLLSFSATFNLTLTYIPHQSINMGSGPSIPAPVMHLLNAVSLGIFVGIMVKIGCEKTGKCRNPRDIELNLPPCNGQVGTNFPCLWTTNTGHQFVSVPSIDVYVKDFQVAWVYDQSKRNRLVDFAKLRSDRHCECLCGEMRHHTRLRRLALH